MAPLEPWQRVRVDAEAYAEDIHSYINCTDCHSGQSVEDMDLAHEGMVDSPTENPVQTCGKCHGTITEAAIDSLHMTLAGYDTALYERSVPEDHPQIEEAERYHCNSCHATCGDCHVSQPANVGGGLLEGHQFVREPSMSRNCTACHGSRVKDEYYGAHEGLSSDVHFRARMACNDCHTGDEMHGVNIDAAHRYDGAAEPACISCHEDQVGIGSGIYQHEVHGTEVMSCQTCHSVSYTNCTNCHVERNEDDIAFFSVESHELDFMIARNDLRSNDRPYGFAPVRHVPVDPTSLSYYDVFLENFDARPTWAYASPHNIQRNTPQTESCLSCHGNDDIFLTTDNVLPEEWVANARIMLEEAPPLPEGYDNVVTGEENAPAASAESSGDGGFWDTGGDSDSAEDSEDSDDGGFWGDDDSADESESSDDSDSFWGAEEPEPETESNDDSSFWDTENNASEPEEDTGADSFWGEDAPSNDSEPTAVPDADTFWGE